MLMLRRFVEGRTHRMKNNNYESTTTGSQTSLTLEM